MLYILGSLIRFSFEEGKIGGLKEFKDKKFERYVSQKAFGWMVGWLDG